MDRSHPDPESSKTQGQQPSTLHHDVRTAEPSSRVCEFRKDKRQNDPRQLVLCFDGTGNKFRGDDSDTNILKIFRMLDRTAKNQYHYYQPGIGTYVVSNNVSRTSTKDRIKSWYLEAKDIAIGSSFDQHVLGGYRFLMQFYSPGDEIYIFGFSRGAYTARFLAGMLDFVGLLTNGNEEMMLFAWQTFSQWQCRRDDPSPKGTAKKKEMYEYMKGFRETFSRPVRRIRFLGLFDTVNSVPRFETAWMGRSKFPYTAQTSAEIIRHAVSIDERRAKFRQDLLYQSARPKWKNRHHIRQFFHDVHQQYQTRYHLDDHRSRTSTPTIRENPADTPSRRVIGSVSHENKPLLAPHRYRSRSRSPIPRTGSTDNISGVFSSSRFDDNDNLDQDIFEVLFAGDHSDVGGGWGPSDGTKPASHIPLTWIVREAIRAGLSFNGEVVASMGCSDTGDSGLPTAQARFQDIMHEAQAAPLHDSLRYKHGLGFWAVTGWKLLEYLPFRRMDLSADGSWKPIRWPLPRGEVRDIPDDAHVHNSVIRRMTQDASYRPGNLIVGGGGRGCRVAPAEYGMGEWVCMEEEGDVVGEIWTKKKQT